MKRSIVTAAAITLMLGAQAGCSVPEAEPAQSVPDTGGWVLPPLVEKVSRGRGSLMVAGRTAPLGRVVLRGSGVTAYAAGADEQGRFEVRIDAPTTDTLFIVEAQRGQSGVPAPYRMLVTADPSGPIALLNPGAASRRLDAGAALDVVDSDGSVTVASGRAPPDSAVTVVAAGRASEVRADSDGHWVVPVDVAGGTAVAIQVGSAAFNFPGVGSGAGQGAADVERLEQGWRIRWTAADASQVSWFPAGSP